MTPRDQQKPPECLAPSSHHSPMHQLLFLPAENLQKLAVMSITAPHSLTRCKRAPGCGDNHLLTTSPCAWWWRRKLIMNVALSVDSLLVTQVRTLRTVFATFYLVPQARLLLWESVSTRTIWKSFLAGREEWGQMRGRKMRTIRPGKAPYAHSLLVSTGKTGGRYGGY